MERSFEWLWDKYKEGARDKFEEVCYKIYKNEHPSAEVKRVRVNQGDGGIDVYIDYGDRYIVAQCKFFRYEVGKSQKDQIISSFKSVDVYCKIKVQTCAKNLYRVLHYFCA